MFSQVLGLWFSWISRWISWLFTLKINTNPDISIGMFLLGCAFIGIIIKFIFGTDFIPLNFGSKSVSNNNSGGYEPKHARKE